MVKENKPLLRFLIVISLIIILAFTITLQAQVYYKTNGPLIKKSSWGQWKYAKGSLYGVGHVIVGNDKTLFLTQNGTSLNEFSRAVHYTAAGKFLNWWGGYGVGDDNKQWLIGPAGICQTPDGMIWISESYANDVKQFTTKGKLKKSWKYPNVWYSTPGAIGCDAAGNIYGIDTSNALVHKMSQKGKLLWTYNDKNNTPEENQIGTPWGVAVYPDGRVAVVDAFKNKVVVIDSKGKFLRKFGDSGRDEGSFMWLFSIAVGPGGLLYTVDCPDQPEDSRIQKFDVNGNFLSSTKIGTKLTGVYYKASRRMIAVAPDGGVCVMESCWNNEFAEAYWFYPEVFKTSGKSGKISGTVTGLSAKELKTVWIRVDSLQNGEKFFATVQPAADGSYAFNKFPVGVTYTITMHRLNTMKYTVNSLSGKSKKNNSGKDLIVTAK